VSYRAAALALCWVAVSCSRRPAGQGPEGGLERLAILRFENLSADSASDWMGRAFAQIITRDLAGAARVYAIPFERLHSRDAAFGIRPIKVPGISAERGLALETGANRIGYGDYAVLGGRLKAQLTIEDPRTQKMARVISASAASVLEAADSLARQISPQAQLYPTRSRAALEAYVRGLESTDAAERARDLEEAMAADPNFGPPQFLLAQLKAQQQDRAGALAILKQALSRKMPELDRAGLGYLGASLEGDSASAREALARWSRADPNDPEVWASIAVDSMGRHQYPQAVQADQKAVAVEPEDVNALNQLGYSAAYAGQLDVAMSALERYRALRPGDANPLDSMGDVNLVVGRLREAQNFYLQAGKRDPAFLNGGDFFKAAMACLMSGDVAAADGLAKQFADARAAAKDPLADFQRAEWLWISGRRREGYQQMEAFARSAANGPARPAASQAYSQLAIWSVALGDRSRGAQLAEKAASLATPASASLAAVARYLAQPSATESEWELRAERAFPAAAQKQERDIALAYALLADKEFAAAAKLLEPIYGHSGVTPERGLPVLLAWAYLESGRAKEAAGLLRFNPIPSPGGVQPLGVFEFPRLVFLRGRLATLAGHPEQAQSDYKLFQKLSGDEPLEWGEEAAAR
jgi:tetratricopeptide (TPR) repeat protein